MTSTAMPRGRATDQDNWTGQKSSLHEIGGQPPGYIPDRIATLPEGKCIDFVDVFGTTAVSRGGYGRIRFDGKKWQAHRLAWCVAGRELPQKPFVIRHRCHNPRCVNVEHLEVGTHRDNARDAIAAGRKPGKVLDTYEIGQAYRLSLFQLPQKDIAAKLGVTQNTISVLLRRRGIDSSHRIPKFRAGNSANPNGRPRQYRAKVNASACLPGFE